MTIAKSMAPALILSLLAGCGGGSGGGQESTGNDGGQDQLENTAPVITSAKLSNSLIDAAEVLLGHTLALSYEYADADGDQDAGPVEITWMRSDSATESFQAIAGATTVEYQITEADLGKFIQVAFKPSSSTGVTPGAAFLTASVAVANNTAPTALGVSINNPADSDNLQVGHVLQGQYQYNDGENDPEGETTYRWYFVDDGTEVELGNEVNLTVPFSARGKTVFFSVTPKATSGIITGESQAASATVQNDQLLFTANNSNGDLILYKTDGGAESIAELKNFGDDEISQPMKLAENRWVFMVNQGSAAATFLYTSDGTDAGTDFLVNSKKPFSTVQGLRITGEYALFSAFTSDNGQELWAVRWKDGKAEFQFVDINTGNRSSDPSNFTYAPEMNAVFFTAVAYNDEGTSLGRELHILDFDEDNGPQLVKDIRPILGHDTIGSVPLNLTWFKDKLYFSAFDGSDPNNGGVGRTLWTSDGTSAGTVIVKNLDVDGHSYPTQFTAVGDDLYFVSNNDSGTEGRLWVTRGTSKSTVKVREDLHGEANLLTAFPANNSLIYRATAWNNETIFWQIQTRNDNPSSLNITSMDQSNSPTEQPLVIGNELVYANSNDIGHLHLAKTVFNDSDDDLRTTLSLGYVTDASVNDAPSDLVELNGRILFSAWGGNGTNRELYFLEYDGYGGPQLLKEFVAGDASGNPDLILTGDINAGPL